MAVAIANIIRLRAHQLHEAGVKEWLKSLLTRIPGLPTKDQALKTVTEFLKKSPEKFEKVVDELLEIMKDVPISGLGRTAFDIKGLMRGIKTVTDPKVILAIIALMGAFQTADAGKLRDFLLNPSLSKAIEEVKESPDKTREERREDRKKRREERYKEWDNLDKLEEGNVSERTIDFLKKIEPILNVVTEVLKKRSEERQKRIEKQKELQREFQISNLESNVRRLEYDLMMEKSDVHRLEYEMEKQKRASSSNYMMEKGASSSYLKTIGQYLKDLKGRGFDDDLERIESIMSRLNELAGTFLG